jgi:hypothetical protein
MAAIVGIRKEAVRPKERKIFHVILQGEGYDAMEGSSFDVLTASDQMPQPTASAKRTQVAGAQTFVSRCCVGVVNPERDFPVSSARFKAERRRGRCYHQNPLDILL